MAKIFLDAGHGGNDPGAIGSRSKEKDNALKVILKLGDYLVKLGHQVNYSRKTDIFVPLSERARQANAWGADIFISAHNNAATATASGFETFIYNGKVSNRTKKLQNDIHDVISKGIGIKDRGKRSANFAVVRETNMSGILIEYAFITNKKDENILINEVDKLALLTANGVAKFYGQKQITTKKVNKVPKNKPDAVHAKAWKWLTDNKITNGKNPKGVVTRQQFATMLKRYHDKFK